MTPSAEALFISAFVARFVYIDRACYSVVHMVQWHTDAQLPVTKACTGPIRPMQNIPQVSLAVRNQSHALALRFPV